MEPMDRWQVLSFADVCRTTVGEIVSIFERAGSRHLVVIEPGDRSAQYVVRGLFSAAEIRRLTGVNIEFQDYASTFVEIEEALNGNHAPV
jgi:hypothetical protein